MTTTIHTRNRPILRQCPSVNSTRINIFVASVALGRAALSQARDTSEKECFWSLFSLFFALLSFYCLFLHNRQHYSDSFLADPLYYSILINVCTGKYCILCTCTLRQRQHRDKSTMVISYFFLSLGGFSVHVRSHT